MARINIAVRPGMDRRLRRDLRVLAKFVEVYCQNQHECASGTSTQLKMHDLDTLVGRTIDLCPACAKLLAHAFVKRAHCPLDPKPACKRCPAHCYKPQYRDGIREVMKYSGRKLVLSGRLDYLQHLLF